MFTKTNKNYSIKVSPIRIAIFLQIVFCFFVFTANAQNANKKNLPGWQTYKDVAIGMTDVQVREKLGAPKTDDKDGFYYVFSDTETAQIIFDEGKKVRTVSVVFSEDHTGAPTFTDVYGKTAVAEPKPDGSIFKMMRYEDAGYWISYSRGAGAKAMVIVTIQKL
ncbi:hypothetical protein BH10ACI1_BH10ACI1_13250 [soil metagenome]